MRYCLWRISAAGANSRDCHSQSEKMGLKGRVPNAQLEKQGLLGAREVTGLNCGIFPGRRSWLYVQPSAAALASLSASLLPLSPACPGHQPGSTTIPPARLLVFLIASNTALTKDGDAPTFSPSSALIASCESMEITASTISGDLMTRWAAIHTPMSSASRIETSPSLPSLFPATASLFPPVYQIAAVPTPAAPADPSAKTCVWV